MYMYWYKSWRNFMLSLISRYKLHVSFLGYPCTFVEKCFWEIKMSKNTRWLASKTPFTRYNRLPNLLANRLDNGLEVCIHDTIGLPAGWPTGWATDCIVYTNIWLLDQRLDESNTFDSSNPSPNSCTVYTYLQPVVQPVGWTMQMSWPSADQSTRRSRWRQVSAMQALHAVRL